MADWVFPELDQFVWTAPVCPARFRVILAKDVQVRIYKTRVRLEWQSGMVDSLIRDSLHRRRRTADQSEDCDLTGFTSSGRTSRHSSWSSQVAAGYHSRRRGASSAPA